MHNYYYYCNYYYLFTTKINKNPIIHKLVKCVMTKYVMATHIMLIVIIYCL